VQLNKNVQHLFSIHNNSKFSFSFSWELSGPADCKQVLTVTPRTGVVQAEGKAETQLAFHPQKMCSLKDVELTLQVTFLNEVTKEYLFYMVTFKATASGPISTVEVTTAVGQRVSATVKVDNPLPVPVTFATNCAGFLMEKTISVSPANPGGSESQGPVPIQADDSTSTPFKNIFLQPMAFQYRVEHPAFTLRTPERLRSKQTTSLSVSFEGGLTPGAAPVTSKMWCPALG
ncbi:unnamed protein product, partial [Bubo scandiacus]